MRWDSRVFWKSHVSLVIWPITSGTEIGILCITEIWNLNRFRSLLRFLLMTKQIMFHLNLSFSKRIVVNVVCLNNKRLFLNSFSSYFAQNSWDSDLWESFLPLIIISLYFTTYIKGSSLVMRKNILCEYYVALKSFLPNNSSLTRFWTL